MSHKHVKLIKHTVLSSGAMTDDIDAQIKALQQKRREQNKGEARKNLVAVVGNKNSTAEQVLSACYTFIGTHRLNSGAPRKAKQPEVSTTQ